MSNKQVNMLEEQLAKQEKLNTELRKQIDLLTKQNERYATQYDHILQAFKNFQRHRFGQRSEKFIDSENPQLSLFEPAESTAEKPSDDAGKNIVEIAAHQRRRNHKKILNPNLPRREVIIPVEDKNCGCGLTKALIRYEITELLHYVPPIYEIIVQKREVLACQRGCQGEIVTAANPPRILPKSPVTADFLAYIFASKFHDRQPFYHMEKKLSRQFGLDCPRHTLSRWCIKAAREVQPLINLLRETLLDYDVASADATSIQVLREPGREPTKKSYAYCMRGGAPGKACIVYDYNAEQHKEFIADWFADFTGYLHVDAQNIFDMLFEREAVIPVYCNAHSRRKFEAIAKQVQSADSLAKTVMRFYQKLYQIERRAKREQLTPNEWHQLRLKESAPLLEQLKACLESEYSLLLPASPIAKAVRYTLKHWDGLTHFLSDGRLSIDNNHTEREIKPWVMARKNYLFSSSVAGVSANCHFMTLIRSGLLHGLEPHRYLSLLFHRLPYCQTLEDYEQLLPWQVAKQSTLTTTKAA